MKEDPRTMDIINPELRGMPQRDYEQEIKLRNFKAGYTTREGERIPLKTIARGFGKSKLNVWPRDPATGELIDD